MSCSLSNVLTLTESSLETLFASDFLVAYIYSLNVTGSEFLCVEWYREPTLSTVSSILAEKVDLFSTLFLSVQDMLSQRTRRTFCWRSLSSRFACLSLCSSNKMLVTYRSSLLLLLLALPSPDPVCSASSWLSYFRGESNFIWHFYGEAQQLGANEWTVSSIHGPSSPFGTTACLTFPWDWISLNEQGKRRLFWPGIGMLSAKTKFYSKLAISAF